MPDKPAILQTVADTHGVSIDAVRHLMRALEAGHGTMAQFNHPELGGFGQWSSGGMTMIGNMFDSNLKGRVAALCTELAQALPPGGWDEPGSSTGDWWPAGLGRPSTSGAQNSMRYAYFPETRRLAVETNGSLALYDTGDHDIGGVSQQQGGSQSLRFTGRNGAVDLEALKRVDTPAPERRTPPEFRASPEPRDADAPRAPEPNAPRAPEPNAPRAPEPNAPRAPELKPFHPEPIGQASRTADPAPEPPSPAPSGDVITLIERLSDLHRKGVLTEQEFASKKADLLARL